MSICYLSNAFAGTLPARTYATEAPKKGLKLVSREKAVTLPYLALNSQFATSYLIFDVDRQGAAFAHEDAGLPQPTYTVINPTNAHAHLIYQVDYVWHRDGDELHGKAVSLLRHLQAAFTLLLDADPGYAGLIAKNPYHSQWRTIHGPTYTLSDLADYLPQDTTRRKAEQAKRQARAAAIQAGESRNVALFDAVRFEAYGRVKDFATLEAFRSWTLERCEALNIGGLPHSELKATAKSVSKYCWLRRAQFATRRRLTPEQIKERQQAAAAATSTRRAEATAAKIEAAIAELEEAQERPTQARLAELAGVSTRTVRAHLQKRKFAPPLSDDYAGPRLAVATVPPSPTDPASEQPALATVAAALTAAGVPILEETKGRRLYVAAGRRALALPQALWKTALDQVETAAHLPALWRYVAFCSWFQQIDTRPPP